VRALGGDSEAKQVLPLLTIRHGFTDDAAAVLRCCGAAVLRCCGTWRRDPAGEAARSTALTTTAQDASRCSQLSSTSNTCRPAR
jgi:hypothetical protein